MHSWEVRGGRTGPLRRQQGLREGLGAGEVIPSLFWAPQGPLSELSTAGKQDCQLCAKAAWPRTSACGS